MRYGDPPIAGAEVCDKSKKVGDDALTGGVVSGFSNKLQRDDYPSSRRQTPTSEITMFRFVSESTNVNFPIDEDVRTSYVNNQDVVPARLKSGFFQE